MIMGADIDGDNDSLIIIMIKTNQNPFVIIFALLYQNDHSIILFIKDLNPILRTLRTTKHLKSIHKSPMQVR